MVENACQFRYPRLGVDMHFGPQRRRTLKMTI